MAGAGEFPKVDGDIIYQADYNAIQSVIAGVVSTYYGNAISSSQISGNPQITAAGLDNLRLDINKAYKHIMGSNSTIADVAAGDIITNEIWNDYKTTADYCETYKNTVHVSQYQVPSSNITRTEAWNGLTNYQITFTWSTAAAAQYFFNAGGLIIISPYGLNSSGSSKDDDWLNNILNAMPDLIYDRNNWNGSAGYDYYEYGNTAQYAENYARLRASKTLDRQITVIFTYNDADTGDQTGAGAAVDEAVGTDVGVLAEWRVSYDAITVESPTAVGWTSV